MTVAARRELVLPTTGVHHHRNRVSGCPEPAFMIIGIRTNLQHPSLRAKKYDEAANIWQARVNDHYRLYFQIRSDTYRILASPVTLNSSSESHPYCGARPEFLEVLETNQISQAVEMTPLTQREGANRHYMISLIFPSHPDDPGSRRRPESCPPCRHRATGRAARRGTAPCPAGARSRRRAPRHRVLHRPYPKPARTQSLRPGCSRLRRLGKAARHRPSARRRCQPRKVQLRRPLRPPQRLSLI